jgi:hypothetical protein
MAAPATAPPAAMIDSAPTADWGRHPEAGI